jgi:hypothetical protein
MTEHIDRMEGIRNLRDVVQEPQGRGIGVTSDVAGIQTVYFLLYTGCE